MRTLYKLRLQAKRFGLLRAGVGVLLDGINRLVTIRVLRVLELRPEWLDPSAFQTETPYQCRFLDREEILHHARDPENRLPEGFVEEAIRKRDQCFGILDEDTLVSFGWYATRPTRLGTRRLFRFPVEWVYMFHGYTRPAYRGQRLHSLGIARAARAFQEQGYAGLVSLLEPTNWASCASSYGMGFRVCGTLLELGSRRRTRFLISRGAQARRCDVTSAEPLPRPRLRAGERDGDPG